MTGSSPLRISFLLLASFSRGRVKAYKSDRRSLLSIGNCAPLVSLLYWGSLSDQASKMER